MFAFDLDSTLRRTIEQRLQKFDFVELDRRGRKHAAVAFTLVDCSQPPDIANIEHRPEARGQAAYILTTRAARLSSHAGQRAYPGGRIDSGESIEQAALRELSEEVGLYLAPGRILGRLDDYATRSGFVISPVVVWGGPETRLVANPAEVEKIHRIPLRELMRDDVPILEQGPASEHPVLKMPLGDEWFAAPSAAIAYQFREVALMDRPTRVAHFDQPHFAWK